MRLGVGFFFGLLLLLAGASIILNVLFKIDLPVFRSVFALFLVYAGLTLLLGGFGMRLPWFKSEHHVVAFSRGEIRPESVGQGQELNVVFGSGLIDLTGLPRLDKDVAVKTNVVFGEGIVRIDETLPLRVHGSAAFADLRLPDGHTVNFGELSYESKGYKKGAPAIILDASAVFGSLRFVEAALAEPPVADLELSTN